jgi:N-sulfoglucosamine sulfohydrolase
MDLDRRHFLRLVTAAGAGLATGPGLAGCGGRDWSRDPDLPNLLFITADNLGWHDLSCYGNGSLRTAHIDRLAREGTRFSRAFVVSSSCAPSRATFITGQYPHTHGVTGLTHLEPTTSLSPFHPTLPEALADAGYHTAIEGKWHVSPFLPTSWYGYQDRLSGLLPEAQRIRDTKKTVAFLEASRDHRFFLQVNYTSSHRDPYGEYAMDPDFPVDPEQVVIPEYMALPDWPAIREDLARYYSQNLRMDAMIGEVLGALDALDLAQRTLVMFVSDNGPHYPGMISTLYDRGTGTPLLVRWPGRVPAGRTARELVSSLDLAPTLLEAAGLAVPDAVQGRSLWPLLSSDGRGDGDGAASWDRDALFFEQGRHVLDIACRAVRTDRWKYIHNYTDVAFGLDQNAHDDWAHRLCELPGQRWKEPRPEEELYDLARDPRELRNLAADPGHAQTLATLRERLDRHMAETDDPYRGHPFQHEFDPAVYEPVEPGHEYW